MNAQPVEQRISECGRQMAMAAVPLYTVNGTVHPPTLVAACARMAGVYLLRSFGLDLTTLKPGEAVLSAQAAERTPLMLRTCAAVLATLGHALPSGPQAPLQDDKTTPRESVLETTSRLQPAFAPLQETFGLDQEQMARAAAVAAAITIHSVRKHLDPVRGFGVAAVALTEGSRTVSAV